MIANGARQHGITRLKSIQNRSYRDFAGDFKLYLPFNPGKVPQMIWQDNTNHFNVWTSTE